MAGQDDNHRDHIVLDGTAQNKGYTAHQSGRKKAELPSLNRAAHGASLRHQIDGIRPALEAASAAQLASGLEGPVGIQIQFESQPEVLLAIESLHNEPSGIELLSVRQDGNRTYANVFVPEGKLAHFEKYIEEYLAEKKDKNGNARDHKKLLNTIAAIRRAAVRELWEDDYSVLPEDPNTPFWWEVWLPVRGDRDAIVADFVKIATESGLTIGAGRVNFPERTVLWVLGSEATLANSSDTLNCIAGLRRAKETADFFDGLAPTEQAAWADNLLARTTYAPANAEVPYVCLLDTGVNRGHALLEHAMEPADARTVEPAWGVADDENHGTGLAGLTLFGDLTDALAGAGPVDVPYRLEAVKLVPAPGGNVGDAVHHAYVFAEAVFRPEAANAERRRIYASAISASDYRDRGRPSSWSAMVDTLASDTPEGGANPRLFILAAGNADQGSWSQYPASLSTNLIHDPGQAWNALTIGAYTGKVQLTVEEAEELQPLALAGALSPHTSTSLTWDSAWPLKPEIVMEGGNVSTGPLGPATTTSLDLLTTHNQPAARQFWTTNATSAASALAANIAANVMAKYPNLKPATIRGLLVHSAKWTSQMKQDHLGALNPTKQQYLSLIRQCGWGVPSLERALWSANNAVTLLIEEELQPYKKDDGAVKTNHMHLHVIPWPKDVLEGLDANVELRITLSYFIEPNPSARGAKSKFHYPSHRLRFDVQRPQESLAAFVGRVNAASDEVDEDDDPSEPKDPNWYLGEKLRHKGSIHQDVWSGTAAELASRRHIAVYPGSGWWRTRPALGQFQRTAPYSLIVSIEAPTVEVDLYAEVVNVIEATGLVMVEA